MERFIRYGALLFLIMLLSGCATKQIKSSVKESRHIQQLYNEQRVAPSDLGEYLRYALIHNGELEAAFNEWKAALQKIPQARSLPDPTFNFTYYVEEVETRVGPQEFLIGGSQRFPWLKKLVLRGDVAAKEALAAQQRYEQIKNRIYYQIKSQYAELYYLNRSIEITRSNIQLLNYFEKVAQAKYRVAAGTHPDVIKVQVELGKLEDKLKELAQLKQPMVAQFNAHLNREIDSIVPLPAELPKQALLVDQKELIEMAKKFNPRLQELKYKMEKQDKALSLAKQDYFPDFTLGADYIDTSSAVIETSDSGKDPVLFKLQASIPLWWERNQAQVEEVSYKKEAVVKTIQNYLSQMEAQLKMSLYHYNDAKRKMNLFRDSLVPKAEQSLKSTQKAFENGSVDFLSLIDTQRVLLEFSLSYERALTNQTKQLADLERIVGRKLVQGVDLK